MADDLLAIYLNDHLAAATAGVEMAKRTARNQRGGERAEELTRISEEICDLRDELVWLLAELGIARRGYKVALGWLAEKPGRLKLNGRVVTHSPLSDVVELEVLNLTAIGHVAMWQVLLDLATSDPRVPHKRVAAALEIASSVAATTEKLRREAASAAFVV